MLRYDRTYYEEVANNYGYAFCEDMTTPLPSFTLDDMKKWLCSYNLGEQCIDGINKENTFITLGVGTNQEPHVGTISQILRGIFFQKKGYKVQIVLGDIDSYNSRSSSISYVKNNVERYRRFITNLGFDTTHGILRNQLDHTEIMKTAFLISQKVTDNDFFDVEEHIFKYYKELGFYSGVSFPVKQAILLMFSDFIHEGFVGNYENIIVLSGVDEHPYVPKTNEIANRLDLPVNICGMFSAIIEGLNGQPKMSKSLRGSSITANMQEREILNIILQLPDRHKNHDNSIVYQLMQSLLIYGTEDLKTIAKHYDTGSANWEKDKIDFAHELSLICSNWNK